MSGTRPAAPRPLPITVVIPVRNEERNLPDCLRSAAAAERVLVVDSQSSDATVAVAEAAGAEVIQFHWQGGFPKKRNWTLQNHDFKTEWVLFLDADERLTDAFVAEASAVLADTRCAGFWLNYTNTFRGRKLRFGVPQRKLALIRVGAGLYERIDEDRWSSLDMEVHEHPVLDGPAGQIASPLDHESCEDLKRFIARHNEYSSWEAQRFLAVRNRPQDFAHLTKRQRLKYRQLARPWFPWAYMLYALFGRAGILDGAAGISYAIFKAMYFFQIREKIIEARETST